MTGPFPLSLPMGADAHPKGGARSPLVSAAACRRRATGRFLVALLLALSATALAHRGHAVWTDIRWNGSAFEITHRLHLADAVTIVRALGGRDAVDTPRNLARLALYVAERFTLREQDTALSTLGAEIEDDFVLVYQEWPTSLPARFPDVDNAVLRDVEPLAQQFLRIRGPGLDEERQTMGGIPRQDSAPDPASIRRQ